MPTLHYIGPSDEIPPGSRKIIQVGRKSIGVFNLAGEFYALLNVCPHQFAPLCQGTLCGYSPPSPVGEFRFEREGEILRCPWHGWEFDIKTGRSVFNPHAVRTGTFPVHVAPGEAFAEEERPVETFPVRTEKDGLYLEIG